MQELRVEELLKVYRGSPDVVAINHVSLEIEAGEMLVLLGPSGCGKTTLLRCIAGLEDAQEGRISIEGRPIFDAKVRLNQPTHLRDIGMVFQNYSLFPHMTVGRNVEYPLRARAVDKGERAARVRQALEVVQCGHLSERLPAMLSGGQQQRVALARALAPKPGVMLLDEPLSNLDALLRIELREQIRAIHRELGFTGIYVTHDQLEAFNLGTRVAVMNAGSVEQLGKARDVYERPATEYVARFLGIRNALTLTFHQGWQTSAGPLSGELPITAQGPAPLQLFLRPGALRLAGPEQSPAGGPDALSIGGARIVETLYSGAEVDYVIEANGVTLYASNQAGQPAFERGDNVHLHFSRRDALIYSAGKLLLSSAIAEAVH